MVATLLTFGHGSATPEALLALLHEAGVGAVVDVRRFPGSRRHPHVARGELESWLPAAGISYRWEERLGGRRRRDRDDDTDSWWRVEAFRAYAAHTRSSDFEDGLAELLDEAGEQPDRRVAVMCSESLWWRCHRRLIADVLVLRHDCRVRHLGHDGRLTDHVPSEGARVTSDGLRYDRPRMD
jgi:uncharacterized protein (DUF488 family)